MEPAIVTASKSEQFIPHGVDREYNAKVEVVYHDINKEAADWLEAFLVIRLSHMKYNEAIDS